MMWHGPRDNYHVWMIQASRAYFWERKIERGKTFGRDLERQITNKKAQRTVNLTNRLIVAPIVEQIRERR